MERETVERKTFACFSLVLKGCGWGKGREKGVWHVWGFGAEKTLQN